MRKQTILIYLVILCIALSIGVLCMCSRRGNSKENFTSMCTFGGNIDAVGKYIMYYPVQKADSWIEILPDCTMSFHIDIQFIPDTISESPAWDPNPKKMTLKLKSPSSTFLQFLPDTIGGQHRISIQSSIYDNNMYWFQKEIK